MKETSIKAEIRVYQVWSDLPFKLIDDIPATKARLVHQASYHRNKCMVYVRLQFWRVSDEAINAVMITLKY